MRRGLLAPALVAALDASGEEWHLREGRKHVHLLVAGVLVVVLSRCPGDGTRRHERNCEAAVRRYLRKRRAA